MTLWAVFLQLLREALCRLESRLELFRDALGRLEEVLLGFLALDRLVERGHVLHVDQIANLVIVKNVKDADLHHDLIVRLFLFVGVRLVDHREGLNLAVLGGARLARLLNAVQLELFFPLLHFGVPLHDFDQTDVLPLEHHRLVRGENGLPERV